MAQEVAIPNRQGLPRMKSVERFSKLPAVEQTVDMANNIYVRVKDTNTLVRSVLNTAETTVKGAVDITLPVTSKLEGPIKMMDSILCSSLDYVETKIPAVKLPLDEMYKSTRDSLYTIPGVKCACQVGEQGVKKAVEIAYGATQYGTQKLKDVKDCLALPHIVSNDPKNSGGQYSLNVKRFLSLLFSWLRITKPHIQQDKVSLNSVEQNSMKEKKETEANSGFNKSVNASGVYEGAGKENHVPNHTKSE